MAGHTEGPTMNKQSAIRKMRKAGIGSIVPIYTEVSVDVDVPRYFAKLSRYGRKDNCILFESADILEKYAEQSIGSVDPCLKARGKGNKFEIIALNETGIKFLGFLKGKFDFCGDVKYGKSKITGGLKPIKGVVSEEERLKLPTQADVLRKIAFAFRPAGKPAGPYAGLFGAISYDFIDQFERLPKSGKDLLKDPDYEMVFVNSLFIYNHRKKKLALISNALLADDDYETAYGGCAKSIEVYRKALKGKAPKPKMNAKKKLKITTDTTKAEFIKIVTELKKNIVAGDIFQAVPSRTLVVDCGQEALDIYARLRKLNPSPYMFYLNFGDGILLGASPEKYLGVSGGLKKTVEIKPIAGTRPRGMRNGKVDKAGDDAYARELLADEKEMAEHTMLVDLARNDVARISVPGTRKVINPFTIEKYSHVQHIVSTVKGTLRGDLDALHAYLASMNMGTLTGAPKIEAMKLLRKKEKTKRGFYGGSVAYLTPYGEFDSAIVIRSMRIKKGKAYLRAGAGIVYDSVPEKEFEETERKLESCLAALSGARSKAGTGKGGAEK